jgi:hypothetical protein
VHGTKFMRLSRGAAISAIMVKLLALVIDSICTP